LIQGLSEYKDEDEPDNDGSGEQGTDRFYHSLPVQPNRNKSGNDKPMTANSGRSPGMEEYLAGMPLNNPDHQDGKSRNNNERTNVLPEQGGKTRCGVTTTTGWVR
jgi:hypothetical protein